MTLTKQWEWVFNFAQDLNPLLGAMELSPYHNHRFPSSAVASPETAQNGLPGDAYGTFSDVPPTNDPNAPLLPSSTNRPDHAVYVDLIPFASWFTAFASLFRKKKAPSGTVAAGPSGTNAGKHVVIAGGGSNIPLEILRTLSEWFGMLEERGTVPGTTLGGMIGLLGALEDSLTMLERILTTPLPLCVLFISTRSKF
jgi:ion channel-forming bestrophin family protein